MPFTAEPDTNTSIYISWGQATPPRTHPLLLRYEILFRDTTNDVNSTFGPFISSQANYTITGLEPYAEYLVSMVATSLQGRSNATSRSATTFPNCKPQYIIRVAYCIIVAYYGMIINSMQSVGLLLLLKCTALVLSRVYHKYTLGFMVHEKMTLT